MQYRNRYIAAQGRFISEDLIGLDGQDINLYRYVGNSPASYIDPDGLQYIASNLGQQLVLEDARAGGGICIISPTRFPAGGTKYRASQNGIVVHYMWVNGICGDHKFK